MGRLRGTQFNPSPIVTPADTSLADGLNLVSGVLGATAPKQSSTLSQDELSLYQDIQQEILRIEEEGVAQGISRSKIKLDQNRLVASTIDQFSSKAGVSAILSLTNSVRQEFSDVNQEDFKNDRELIESMGLDPKNPNTPALAEKMKREKAQQVVMQQELDLMKTEKALGTERQKRVLDNYTRTTGVTYAIQLDSMYPIEKLQNLSVEDSARINFEMDDFRRNKLEDLQTSKEFSFLSNEDKEKVLFYLDQGIQERRDIMSGKYKNEVLQQKIAANKLMVDYKLNETESIALATKFLPHLDNIEILANFAGQTVEGREIGKGIIETLTKVFAGEPEALADLDGIFESEDERVEFSKIMSDTLSTSNDPVEVQAAIDYLSYEANDLLENEDQQVQAKSYDVLVDRINKGSNVFFKELEANPEALDRTQDVFGTYLVDTFKAATSNVPEGFEIVKKGNTVTLQPSEDFVETPAQTITTGRDVFTIPARTRNSSLSVSQMNTWRRLYGNRLNNTALAMSKLTKVPSGDILDQNLFFAGVEQPEEPTVSTPTPVDQTLPDGISQFLGDEILAEEDLEQLAKEAQGDK